jgi:hypothetical protein
MMQERDKNKTLTKRVTTYTITACTGRQRPPKHTERSGRAGTPGQGPGQGPDTFGAVKGIETEPKRITITVDLAPGGARLYVRLKSKDGSSKEKEKNH